MRQKLTHVSKTKKVEHKLKKCAYSHLLLGFTALSVYYAMKKKGKTKVKKSIKPRSSALCTFDKKGNLIIGKGESLENTVRASRGSDDMPLLFFVLRDSYSRIGGARFVIAACNGKQFTPDTPARVVMGVPKRKSWG